MPRNSLFAPPLLSGNHLSPTDYVLRIIVLFGWGLGRGFSQKSRLPSVPYSVKKGVWVKAQMSAARVTMQPRVVATTS